jgi:allantoin racemase
MIEEGDFFQELFAGQEDVDVVSLTEGPVVSHTRVDYALGGPDSIIKAKEGEKAGYKAIVLTCNGDPNLYPIREAVRIPVLGPSSVSFHFCSMLAHRFSVLVPNRPGGGGGVRSSGSKADCAALYGLTHKIASVRAVPFTVLLEEVGRLSRQKPIPDIIMEPMVNEIIKAINEDQATAITFGCAYFAMMEKEVKKRLAAQGLDVLLINPLPIAVDVARILVKNKLSHSALSFPLATENLMHYRFNRATDIVR